MANPSYLRVFGTFARNSLVRDMTFRWNFLTQVVTNTMWMVLQLIFYVLLFQFTDELGEGTGWGKFEFFVFLATAMFVRSLVEGLVMPNLEAFSEMIRKGDLDFVLLRPIDTQFLVSFQRVEWSALGTVVLGLGLMIYALTHLGHLPGPVEWGLYLLYVGVGAAILYALLLSLAAASVWLGRNESVMDLWFYLTMFARYPLEIYRGPLGTPIRQVFTWVIPVLIAINVPARLVAKPLQPDQWPLALYGLGIMAVSLLASRGLFHVALGHYRSASS